MCGIVGAVNLTSAPQDDAVLATLAHRGPDAEGRSWDPASGTWLGFRRLAVLDLDVRASQPMVDEASGTTLVFNGEVYNYTELRAELVQRGRTFRTTGDTEVLLQGYLEWGDGVFERVNGMFAAAIRRPGHEGVLLARDRFGEKPLFYGRRADGSWWFGSEVSALVAAGVGGRRLRLERVAAFLLLGDIEDPTQSYVEGIDALPPGTIARLTPMGLRPVRRFFDPVDLGLSTGGSPPADPEEVSEALDRSVALRLRSDVPVGTSLSGGVDSSAVVASIRSHDASRTVHSFTASFPGTAIDEWDRVELVAGHLGLATHRVEPTVDGFLADLDDLVWHQGGPIEGPTVYAQWCVMREASRHGVTVLLDGQGADEAFGGYFKHVGFAAMSHLMTLELGDAAALVRAWRPHGAWRSIRVDQALALAVPDGARRTLLAARHRATRSALGPAFADVRPADPFGGENGTTVLARAASIDLRRVLLPRLLRYADRNSMAWSRELRLPFLDPDLLEVASRIDWTTGLGAGWTKLALRQAIAPRLPSEIVWRRDKTAYEVPTSAWLARPEIRSAIDDATASLVAAGVLAGSPRRPHDPWRVLSLSRFMHRYDLTP